MECLTGASLSAEASQATAGKDGVLVVGEEGWRVPAPPFLTDPDVISIVMERNFSTCQMA